MVVTNCTGERSFSVLKNLKNEMRSTMLNDRLSYFAIMCIESDVLDQICIDSIVNDFVEKKARNKM